MSARRLAASFRPGRVARGERDLRRLRLHPQVAQVRHHGGGPTGRQLPVGRGVARAVRLGVAVDGDQLGVPQLRRQAIAGSSGRPGSGPRSRYAKRTEPASDMSSGFAAAAVSSTTRILSSAHALTAGGDPDGAAAAGGQRRPRRRTRRGTRLAGPATDAQPLLATAEYRRGRGPTSTEFGRAGCASTPGRRY